MAIPDYQTLMLPLLRLCSDGGEHTIAEAVERLSNEFNLSPEERTQQLRRGQTVIYSRVYWARTYLNQAGLLDSPKRGTVIITERGMQILSNPPEKITNDFLNQFEEFRDFRKRSRQNTNQKNDTGDLDTSEKVETPEETIEAAYRVIRNDLSEKLLMELKKCSPDNFERIVVDVIVAMGYGGTEDAGQVVGGSGDGGIDGLIKEDRLGLDWVYLQAKRWQGTVPVKEIRDFAGALSAHHVRKGVFITTSDFTSDAAKFVEKLDAKVVLINGHKLADLMIDFNVGVTKVSTFEIKKVDSDYFSPLE